MLTKIKSILSNAQPMHFLIAFLILGLSYGSISLYMKITKFSALANKTRITAVKINHIKLGTAKKIYQTISTIEALQSVEITSKVNGIVEKINFIEGSEISRGDKIFSILSSDTAGRIEIHAPFNGKLGLSNVNIGDQVSRNQVLTTLDNSSQMKIKFDLPENNLTFIKKNLSFEATSEVIKEKVFHGKIDYIDSRIDEQSRTIRVYAILNNQNNILKPGLFMKIKLILQEKQNAFLIPEEALLSINKKHYVYVANNDNAKIREVSVGIRMNELIEIKKGLDINDRIIVLGHEKLKDGSKIKILN